MARKPLQAQVPGDKDVSSENKSLSLQVNSVSVLYERKTFDWNLNRF